MIKAEQDIYLPAPATLTDIQPVTASEKFFAFQMDADRPLSYMPGQFLEITVPGVGEVPISITSSPTEVTPGEFHMVIRNMGNVTGVMHNMESGSKVGVRGPYGTCFPVDTDMKGKDLLFVCGGIGLVPVCSAIKYVLDHREDYGHITILIGTRSPEDRLFTDMVAQWEQRDDITLLETVDTATPEWKGHVGVITTLFSQVKVDPAQTVAIICGPPIMYKFVLIELEKMGFASRDIFMSLERNMKCGVGKCGHCQINGIYACQDGPVVRFSDISTIKEAI